MYAYWDAVARRNTGQLREISNKALQQFLEVSSKATLVPLQHGLANNEELSEGNLNILIALLKTEVTLSGDATSVMQQRRTIERLLGSAADVQRGQLQYLGSLADERIKDAIRLIRPVVYASICSFELELCGSKVGVRLTSEQLASVPVVGANGCISESADLSELLTAAVADLEQQVQVTPNLVGLVNELFSSYITQLADLTGAADGSAQQLLCSLTEAMRTDNAVLNGHDSEAFLMIMAAVQLSLLQEVLRGKRGDIDNDAGPWEYVGNLVGCILTRGTAAELDAMARTHGGSEPEREEANSPFSNVYTALCASQLLCKDLHSAVVDVAAAEHSPRVLASILSKHSSTQLPACDNGLRICATQIAYRKLARPLKATLRLGWPAHPASVFPICCVQTTLRAAIQDDLVGISDAERGLLATAGLAGGFLHTLQVLHELQPWWAVDPVGVFRLLFDACCAVDSSEEEASTHLLLLSRLLVEVAALVKLSASEALTATAFNDALESEWSQNTNSGTTRSQDRWWAMHVLLVIQFVGDSREHISAEVCCRDL
jgi:hypothetical protein